MKNHFDREREERKVKLLLFSIGAFLKSASDFGNYTLYEPRQKGFKNSIDGKFRYSLIDLIRFISSMTSRELLLCNLSSWWKASIWRRDYLVVAWSSSIIHVHVKAVYKTVGIDLTLCMLQHINFNSISSRAMSIRTAFHAFKVFYRGVGITVFWKLQNNNFYLIWTWNRTNLRNKVSQIGLIESINVPAVGRKADDHECRCCSFTLSRSWIHQL